MDAMLSCDGIHKTFTYRVHRSLQDAIIRRSWPAEQRRVPVLEDIDLSVRPGEWVGIYGPNGCGKTTLLHILAGVLPPDCGKVASAGSISIFAGLGVGFEVELSADKNIYFHCLLHGSPLDRVSDLTERIIAFAELEKHRDMPLKYYSSGMLLRLAFAAAAHMDADIYLLDEVLAVGDAVFQRRCEEHLNGLKAAGKTAVIVNHSLPHLRMFCDRVETIKDRRLGPLEHEGV
jgi:ABC-type polysaccharide/polyol phosphate transport system ATPase subunit